jgi:hypothetical protein
MLDPEIERIVSNVANEYDLPKYVWYPIIMYESGGNPNVSYKTSQEDSRGLFQVNTFAHPNANSSMLFDPEYNARYQIPELSRVFKQGQDKGLSGVDLTKYVAKFGQRPLWSNTIEQNIEKYYQELSLPQADLFGGGGAIQFDGEPIPSEGKNIFQKGLEAINPSTYYNKVLDFTKLSLFNVFIFVILMFSVYVAFVRKTQIEEVGKDIVKTGVRVGKGIASKGTSEIGG